MFDRLHALARMAEKLTVGFAIGTLGGLMVVAGVAIIEHVSAEGLKSSDFATLVAGVLGAVVGGLISYFISKQTGEQMLLRDQQQRDAELELAALRTLIKVQRIANQFDAHKNYFWDELRTANGDNNLHLPLWRIVRRQVGSDELGIDFDSTDFTPLQAAGRLELINDCTQRASRLGILERCIGEYNRLRGEIDDLLVQQAYFLSSNLPAPPELTYNLKVKGAILEQFIRSTFTQIRNEDVAARLLCKRVSSAFLQHFGPMEQFKLSSREEGPLVDAKNLSEKSF